MNFVSKAVAGLACVLGLLTAGAQAQTTVKPCIPVTNSSSGIAVTSCQDVTAANPLPVVDIPSSTPIPIFPGPVAYTDTPKSLTAATDTTLLAAATTNKSVCVMNIGTNPVTITNGAGAAAVGSGQALAGASVAGQQGGGYCWPLPPTNEIHGISTGGTTVIVTVGQ